MKEKNIKILIILVIILIIIVSVCLSMLYLKNNQEKNNNLTENIEEDAKNNIQGILKQNIQDLEYNEIEYIHVTDKQMAQKYLNDYMQLLQTNPKQAYNLLKEEYQEKRFETYEQYNAFLQNYDIALQQIVLNTVTVDNKEDNTTIYTCRDQYGNIYLFEETGIMEYTVQLDDYTLENEAFNQKYEKADSRDKGILNIDKFFEMINRQDYTSAYALLDTNFKQNYFKTQVEFENYMKNKTFRYNTVEYKEYSNQITDIYTYKIVLTDATKQNSNQIEFNIVMKLLEGTNFVMSFDVN